jgi:SAM-dependent methyltransferase
MSDQIGLYADPPVYDVLHARGTARDVRGLERIADRFLPPHRGAMTWLEPACGTGRLLAAAARRGARVVGFDRNPEMIEYARRRAAAAPWGRRARFFVADMRAFADLMPTPRVGMAFNLINTIRHLDRDAHLVEHMHQIRRVLHPGGVYAVGITLTTYGMEFPSEDVWEGARGRLLVRQVVQYVPPLGPAAECARREVVHSHLIVTRPGCPAEHRDSTYTLRCYNLRQWRALLGRSGMRVLALVGDDGEDIVASPSGYGVWVLTPSDAP